MVDLEFILRVLRVTAFENTSDIWWRTDNDYAPVTFMVICNDVFWWGTADLEDITPENIDLFEQSYKDSAANGDKYQSWGALLFCARVRKMRPQGAAYPKEDEKGLWPLFDACGEEREVGHGNPYPHPRQNRG